MARTAESCNSLNDRFYSEEMASSNRPTGTPSRGKATVIPEFGVELLSRQISEAKEILETRLIEKVAYISWQHRTRNYVEKAFGENHRNVRSFEDVAFWSKTTWSLAEASEHYAHRLRGKIVALEGYVKELETEIEIQEIGSSAGTDVKRELSNKVFIVHGHNDALKHTTARLVTSLGLEPVILHEQSNRSQTIIEKLTVHADVGFAIVLLSADDEGRSRVASSDPLKHRARQNVIFEMGYFFSRLGRERVCAVYESGVELPSDLSGILYVPYDSEKGGWMYAIAKEMKSAGTRWISTRSDPHYQIENRAKGPVQPKSRDFAREPGIALPR
jgi:predicted nucleotide-binding protein